MRIQDDWYDARKIAQGVWSVSDGGKDVFYAIIGEKRAMMVDNGYGVGRLDRLLEQLSDKPWFTVNTHGDIDHALGNDYFPTAYVGEADFSMLGNDRLQERRQLALRPPDAPFVLDAHIPGGCFAKETLPLHDAQTFDLGGRVVTAYLIPGHSPGSACLIDSAARLLLIGDMYVPLRAWGPMWLHLPRCASLETTAKSVRRILAMRTQYDGMASGHGNGDILTLDGLDELSEMLEAVVAGRLTGTPTHQLYDGLMVLGEQVGFVYAPSKLVG